MTDDTKVAMVTEAARGATLVEPRPLRLCGPDQDPRNCAPGGR